MLIINSARLNPTTNIILSGCLEILSKNPSSSVICVKYAVLFSTSSLASVMDSWVPWAITQWLFRFSVLPSSPWLVYAHGSFTHGWPLTSVYVHRKTKMIDHFVNSMLLCFDDMTQGFWIFNPFLCHSCLTFVSSFCQCFAIFKVYIISLYLQRYFQRLSFLSNNAFF